ncbi:hypothetical protein FNF28_02835 [Cafeteria roenbergensis]|uniref:Uncharacterized protein n=1 Tax=Cafeteria roenbergensis TaxID=33653 RepID=A0A5A8DPE0_CAFRO|nr:hypothetical protein FNF28_02835 [Cafeteria roenbergensis]
MAEPGSPSQQTVRVVVGATTMADYMHVGRSGPDAAVSLASHQHGRPGGGVRASGVPSGRPMGDGQRRERCAAHPRRDP